MSEKEERKELLRQIWNAQDSAWDLMVEYDSLPHHYGDNVLYQAEGHIIDLIAAYPGLTVTELSAILKKTVSACSQIVHKLRDKGWVEQKRNRGNNRQYNLNITESGMEVYRDHQKFELSCRSRTNHMLEGFSTEELKTALRVQEKLNEAYQEDVRLSREYFTKL